MEIPKGQYYWKIEEVDGSDYKIKLVYHATGFMIKRLFESAKNKLKRKLGKDIGGNLDIIERFEVPEDVKKHFFPVLKNAIKKHIRNVKKQCKPDGFSILNYEVDEAIYTRLKNDDWEIEIIVKGQFIQK